MKKVIYLSIFILGCIVCQAQTDSTSKKLVPVESLMGKIKPDTSKLNVTVYDTIKGDTVYIDNPLNVVKAGINLPSAYGFAFLTYERVLHYMGSIQIKLEYLGTYNPLKTVSFIEDAYKNTLQINGIGITPEGRYYGSDKYAPKGVFVGFYIPMQFASVKAPPTRVVNNTVYSLPSSNISYSLFGFGFDAGYQYIFKNYFSIEALIGVSIARGKFSTEFYTKKILDPYTGKEYEGKVALNDGTIGRAFYPRAEISVGYAF
ncbi:MAG: DUF3575 domain-containing protein [Opitutaceae bacterium]|nr:DUF3575 domain-containing protein [Cytophagales bacterium]